MSNLNNSNPCLFCKILHQEIPAEIVYEDEHVIAFKDIHPKAPVHLLVIPKTHIASLLDLSQTHLDLMGKLTLALPKIAQKMGLSQGFKIQINTGIGGGQEVFHLHYHLMGKAS